MTANVTATHRDWFVLADGSSPFNFDEGHWTTFPTEEAANEFATKRWPGAHVFHRVTEWLDDLTVRETLTRTGKGPPT